MRSRWFHSPVLHVHGHQEKRATWLELFYDLIFVAAFIQLGNGLSDHLDAAGVLTFAGVFVPMWVTWVGFAYFENRFTLDDFLHRLVVFVQMGCVGAMALSAPDVLDGNVRDFALAAGAAQGLVGLMYARAIGQVDEARDYNILWGGLFSLAGVLWIIGAFTGPLVTIGLGIGATLLVLAAPLAPHSRRLALKYPFDFEHLGERFALLTLIVLGEAFVKLLSSLGAEGVVGLEYTQAGSVLLITCGIWWVYFDDVAGQPLREGRFHHQVWLYAHLPLQMAIVALGVSLKKALGFHFDEPAEDGYRWLLAGTLGMVYLSVAIIDSVTERKNTELSNRSRVNIRWISALILVVLAAAGRSMSGGLFLALVIALAISQVLFDLMIAPLEEDPTAGRAKHLHELSEENRAAMPRRDISEAIRKGTPSSLRRDLFFYVIEGSWLRVFVLATAAFTALNLFFAGLYALEPGSIAGAESVDFATAFAFSVQTMATIGYGGLTPATDYANAIVACEAALSMIGVAIVTGFIVAKATRAKASVLFSEVAIVTTMNGMPSFQFRAGNARGNEVVDAKITVSAVIEDVSPEGHHFRSVVDLKLRRTRTPVFMLSWTVIHEIDEDSPLFGIQFSDAHAQGLNAIVITMTGHDGTYGQTVHARHTYLPEDLRVDERFVDVLHQLDDGRLMIDYSSFHDTVPDDDSNAEPNDDAEQEHQDGHEGDVIDEGDSS